jgi:hypothetical protein
VALDHRVPRQDRPEFEEGDGGLRLTSRFGNTKPAGGDTGRFFFALMLASAEVIGAIIERVDKLFQE